MKYKNKFILVLISIIIAKVILSCSESDVYNHPEQQIVTINSIILEELDNINISASLQNIDISEIEEKGFCWSNISNPQMHDNKVTIPISQLFSTKINNVGQDSLFYFRAYVKNKSGEIIYSDEVNIETKKLQIVWEKEYENGKLRDVKQVVKNNENSFIILTKNYGSTTWSGLTKIDDFGSILWEKEYNQNEFKEPKYLLRINDGYLIVTMGYTSGNISVNIIKTDINGVEILEKNFSRQNFNSFLHITPSEENTFTLITNSSIGTAENGNALNCKLHSFVLDTNLNIINEVEKVSNHCISNYSSLSLNDNKWIVAAHHLSLQGNIYDFDIKIQKYDLDNQFSWEKIYGGNGNDLPVDLMKLENENFVLLGSSESNGDSSGHCWIVEIDENNGNIISEWTYRNLKHGNQGFTRPLGFFRTFNEYYITGFVTPYHYTQSNSFIIKVDQNGEVLWEYVFDNITPIKYSRTNTVFVNNENDIYLFGSKINELSDKSNFLTITKIRED